LIILYLGIRSFLSVSCILTGYWRQNWNSKCTCERRV